MLQWNGPQIIDRAREEMAQRVEAAAIYLQTQVREKISIPSRTVKYKQGKGGKIRRILGPKGSSRSRPGEPPHKDTGTLRQRIMHETDFQAIVSRVGSNLGYAKDLELGTKHMAARPFLRRTLAENHEPIRQILERGHRYSISVGD